MPTVHVNLGPRSYDIEIGSGNLARGRAVLRRRAGRCACGHHHRRERRRAVQRAGGRCAAGGGREVDILIVEAGEQSKSPDVAAELWEQMLDEGADRKTVVVALGGGVVGDLAGFVAATFARGLRFVQSADDAARAGR